MTDYSFSSLNDKEFEIMVVDLLGRRDQVRYERFKPGRDAGVDGRYFHVSNGEVILQCKHWPMSSLKSLIQKMESGELPKIRRINPKRYILALSHPLSRKEKDSIADKLRPYIQPNDILGREDLNDLLSYNKDVELRHYKLWINSTNVLSYFANKAILDRSAFDLQEIQRNAKIYVATENHEKALDKLENLGTVIITGLPGIGKTTLADHLILHYVSQGYEFFRIAEDMTDAESVFSPERKQIFLFDDFLGRNYLEALSGHEGSRIVHFIKRVNRDRSKKFILTSRSTILNQGKLLIDQFHNNNIQKNEFEISFESLSEIDKARILYNHIWHSDLPEEFVDKIYEQKDITKLSIMPTLILA